MCALGCRCARHIFRQWQKECCHGNGILWQKWGKNLASRTTSSATNSHEIWHICLQCARHIFFDSGRKCLAMVTAYYGKNGGKILRNEGTFCSVFHQYSWNLAQMFALGCRCASHCQKKMCLAHLHPKANICAKFHENWWKTEEVVRDAIYSPHFCCGLIHLAM